VQIMQANRPAFASGDKLTLGSQPIAFGGKQRVCRLVWWMEEQGLRCRTSL